MVILKEIAKKSSILYWINAKIKCYVLKRDSARLAHDYKKSSVASAFIYEPEGAIGEFRRRHLESCPDFVPREAGALRVLWIGSSKDQDESGFIQALRRLCNVAVFLNIEGKYGTDFSPSAKSARSFAEIRQANDQELLQQIVQAINMGGIDFLLGQMWAHRISKEVLAKVRTMGIPVINISMDDRLPANWAHKNGIRLGSVGLTPGLDMVLTTSPETCLWYGVENCPALFWPLASDPKIFAPAQDAVHDIDVLFIGNKYGMRGEIVRYLENRGVKVDCYGRGWPNGYINAKQMAELSKRARIILGVGTVGHCPDVYTLKLRDFDALMTGALYLTHRNPDLCRLYREGEEIECYVTPKEAFEKIRFYLDHPDELKRIARNGQQKAISRDTWDKRLLTTFEQLGLLRPVSPNILEHAD